MDDKRFSKVGRTTDALTCAVDEAQDLCLALLSGKVSAEQRKDLANEIQSRLNEISDAADTIYSQCEEDYAEGEDLVDTEVYASVLNRLPLAHQVRTDQIMELCELLDKWRADNGYPIVL